MELNDEVIARINSNPKYQALKAKRNAFGWLLTVIMLAVYYGYILVIAFSKQTLATKLSDTGVTTLGIPVGVAIIVFTILITGFYVRRANGEFAAMTDEIIKEAQK